MRIIITGARGLVGSALSGHFKAHSEVVPLTHRELDITDETAVAALPLRADDVIFNCAVVGVDDCERDPALARRVNVTGPELLARAAARANATLVHFSTNYVFDGERSDGGFYDVDDDARPVNVYGATKLEGEQRLLRTEAQSIIIRTSWVFGRGSRNFLSTLPQKLAAGEPVNALTDIFASTTFVEDLVERVAAITAAGASGIFHVNNSGVCSYAEFADEVTKLMKQKIAQPPRINYQQSGATVRTAPRPRWTPMQCSHTRQLRLDPLRRWQDALAAYVGSL